MNLHSNASSVPALRAEIDRIDDALLDLVDRRADLTAAMAALKAGADSPLENGRLKIRPRREAEVVGRLTRAARRAPPDLVEHLWRTLMSYGLRDQAPMRVLLHAPGGVGRDDRLALQAAARDRFGPAPAMDWARSERHALDLALTDEVVALIVRDAAPDLAGTPLRAFETLRLRSATAHAIGRVDPADIVGSPSA